MGLMRVVFGLACGGNPIIQADVDARRNDIRRHFVTRGPGGSSEGGVSDKVATLAFNSNTRIQFQHSHLSPTLTFSSSPHI
jgi:hypothetical protein